MTGPLAVYVHCPFCPSKCGYCDFNSYAMSGDIVDRVAQSMIRDIEESPIAGRPAKTIFFGGGTPTFFSAEQLSGILGAVMRVHPPVADAEITSEANPGTADATLFEAMRGMGFNRLSLGAQSFKSDDLVRLGRVHQSDDIGRAVSLARAAGFDNLNLDLMFALPGQTDGAWRRNLVRAVELDPTHISLYCLTLEPNTAFYREHLRGTLIQPDEDAQVEMYESAVEVAEGAGYQNYEISNFARPGFECRHNLCYWRGEEYAGYGPGAVASVIGADGARRRSTKLKHPVRYCDSLQNRERLTCEEEDLDEAIWRTERIMLGIRLTEGVAAELCSKSGRDLCQLRGWITNVDGRVRLTPLGRHYCTEVAAELL